MKAHPYSEWSVPEAVWKGKQEKTVELRNPVTDTVEFVPVIVQRCVGYDHSRPVCVICSWQKSHLVHR